MLTQYEYNIWRFCEISFSILSHITVLMKHAIHRLYTPFMQVSARHSLVTCQRYYSATVAQILIVKTGHYETQSPRLKLVILSHLYHRLHFWIWDTAYIPCSPPMILENKFRAKIIYMYDDQSFSFNIQNSDFFHTINLKIFRFLNLVRKSN